MYSTIVAGTDGSETAARAVGRAAELARLAGATVHLVHGYGGPTLADANMMAMPVVLTEEAVKELDAELERQASQLRHEGVEVSTHLLAGSGAEALLRVADEVDADLIVVGSRGMTGAMRFLLGSVPNAVSHHASCSVLIVRTV